MPEIRAVTLDLDGTMLDRRATFEAFVRGQITLFPYLFEGIDRAGYFDRVVELDRDGYTAKDVVFSSVAAEFGLPDEATEVLPADFRNRFPDECVYPEELIPMLMRFRALGYRLAVITNGGVEIQQRKIDVMGIGELFDHIAISEAEGVTKPDPEIFRRTLERLGEAATSAVHVGDNPRADIAGAKDAGLRAVWHSGPRFSEAARADAVIHRITDLPKALEELLE